MIERGKQREKEGGRTEGQGDGGKEEERRGTMRLLMRTFWGAYVGHCMNKQTFTSLHRWFTHSRAHTEPRCVVYVPSLAIYTHTHAHISLLKRQRHAHMHSHTARLSCIHSFMDVAPSCPLFKLVGVLMHRKFGHVSLFYTHTHCLALWLTFLSWRRCIEISIALLFCHRYKAWNLFKQDGKMQHRKSAACSLRSAGR